MSHTFRYVLDHEPLGCERVALPDADAHHLTRVVRRGVGDRVEVIAPSGAIWPATLAEAGPQAVLELAAAPSRTQRHAPITVCVGLCEWGRLDVAVEKCTELGVERIVIFAGERSRRIPSPAAWERRRDRLIRVAQAAARQSGQGRLPDIEGVWTRARVGAAIGDQRAIVLDPDASIPFVRALAEVPAGAPLVLVIGPDTGLTDGEVNALRAAGAEVCHLGDTTLRAETAAIVAASIALAATGQLERGPHATPTDGESSG